jgi:hypothetical protein
MWSLLSLVCRTLVYQTSACRALPPRSNRIKSPMGVNVTFETTLARVSENGMRILLGSSQAQVVSAQDGIASIAPSAGRVGPCDVFITVSAGQSTAQFQIECGHNSCGAE